MFVASASADNYVAAENAVTLDIPVPPHVDGDELLLITADFGNANVTVPAPWGAAIGTFNIALNFKGRAHTRIAAAEPAFYTITTTSAFAVGAILVYRHDTLLAGHVDSVGGDISNVTHQNTATSTQTLNAHAVAILRQRVVYVELGAMGASTGSHAFAFADDAHLTLREYHPVSTLGHVPNSDPGYYIRVLDETLDPQASEPGRVCAITATNNNVVTDVNFLNMLARIVWAEEPAHTAGFGMGNAQKATKGPAN